MTTTSNFQLRPPTEADIPALAELRNRWSLAINGTTITTEKQVQSEWNEPGYDPHKDSIVALNGDQRIVGEAALYVRPPYVIYYAGASVHPDWKGQGIGTILTAWLEQTVRERFALAPAEARIALISNIVGSDEAARQLLLELGYGLIRIFHEMEIVMDAPPAAANFSEGITIQRFDPQRDSVDAYRAMQDAFHDHYGHVPVPFEEGFPRWWHHVTEHPHYDPGCFFLAMDGDEIAGYVFAFPQDYEIANMAWIDNLGVRRPWRKRGLGLALLQHSFADFYQRGIRRVGLAVDADSLTGATRLYEKAGMKTFRRWERYSKVMRDGKDLMRK